MKNKVLIKVICDSDKFINYLVYHNINYSSLKKNKGFYILKVDIDNYKTISRMYDTEIIRYYGIKYILNSLSLNRYMYISLIICLFFLYLLTSTIFDIQINTNDILLKNKIIDILNENDIKLFKRKKTYDELNKIKGKILSENNNLLQWIEINTIGCKYIIDLTKKVNNDKRIETTPNDIIASKDGVVKSIVVHSGSKIKEKNEYVKKGDVLISGSILKNENIIDEVPASGKVYAEVWYLVKINIPFEYSEAVPSGKVIKHYYINIFNKNFTILGKYDKANMKIDNKLLIDKPYLHFKLYKETKKEMINKKNILSENDAYEKGINEADKMINKTLSKDEYIISKNVLKKHTNSSKMYLEVFYKVYESIGVTSDIMKREELNEISNN